MSSQPFPPTNDGGTRSARPDSGARRNPVLLALGVLLLVAGVVGGLLLVSAASSSVGDNAKELARAPGGCTTSLEFDKTGEFILFYERRGTVADLAGDCDGNGASFDRGDDEPPAQTLELTGPNGEDIAVDDAAGASYDASGFTGTQIATIRIEEAGIYRLAVTPSDADDADYAIAIGKDPAADEGTLKALGLGALIAGVVLGALLILLGLRRRGGTTAATVTAAPANIWTPGSPTPNWQSQSQSQSGPIWQPQPSQPPAGPPPGFGSPPAYAPPPPPSTLPPSPPVRPFEDPTERPPTNPFSPPRPRDD